MSTVTGSSTDDLEEGLAKIVEGTFDIPNYLTEGGAPGSDLRLDPATGRPVAEGGRQGVADEQVRRQLVGPVPEVAHHPAVELLGVVLPRITALHRDPPSPRTGSSPLEPPRACPGSR